MLEAALGVLAILTAFFTMTLPETLEKNTPLSLRDCAATSTRQETPQAGS